jgi:hypothetical protein
MRWGIEWGINLFSEKRLNDYKLLQLVCGSSSGTITPAASGRRGLKKPYKSVSFAHALTARVRHHSPPAALFWGPFSRVVSRHGGEGESMALTEIAVRTAKAAGVDRKLADEKGLHLLVTVSGSKRWRLKYRIDGREKKLALVSYPEVGLKDARNRRDSARRAAESGSDPAAAKREARIARQFSASNTFGAIAEEYITKLEAEKKADVTIAKLRWLLSKLSPSLGRRPITEITPHELLAILKTAERKGHRETAHRLRSFATPIRIIGA